MPPVKDEVATPFTSILPPNDAWSVTCRSFAFKEAKEMFPIYVLVPAKEESSLDERFNVAELRAVEERFGIVEVPVPCTVIFPAKTVSPDETVRPSEEFNPTASTPPAKVVVAVLPKLVTLLIVPP